jgi:hypothetical protein
VGRDRPRRWLGVCRLEAVKIGLAYVVLLITCGLIIWSAADPSVNFPTEWWGVVTAATFFVFSNAADKSKKEKIQKKKVRRDHEEDDYDD